MVSQYQKYMKQSVSALTAGEQINLLFDQACVNISKAIEAIEKKDIVGAHNSIMKTENIFNYLIDSLDMSYPISKNLLALYDFINDRLIQANIKKDIKPLREAQKIATELRDTWKKAEVLARTGG
ncbi:MAG TPA: flagellar export chaperone FliS [Bacillota bacterium]|nr:flagellar export chaperone FliS [Bacillota bacterium]HOK69749.1 flagellar export chaperone FliS [Bacillota bacterium]HPP86150.1 flagellar export chaperone FliS [Bacillota bacterium]